jgi:hypothetical protein
MGFVELTGVPIAEKESRAYVAFTTISPAP